MEESSGLTTSRSTKGSIRYMSPELFQDNSKHTLESDVWAWGCTAFEVLTGNIPYSEKQSDAASMVEICRGSAPGLISTLASLIMDPAVDPVCQARVSALQSIIPQCWKVIPTERPLSSDALHSITNPSQWEGDFGARKDQEAGTSSFQIGADFGNQEDEAVRKQKLEGLLEAQKASQRDNLNDTSQDPNNSAKPREQTASSPAPPKGFYKLSFDSDVIVSILMAVTLCGL
ncbi:hypothetical protein FRC01_002381 [Tulasnella sp. 417]|nr:hypothetical protein FRC01_002381 [Tulasnella sp. 417]